MLMMLCERFSQPENFDRVADGNGWKMYAGGNDWENGITGICVTFPGSEQLERIWMTVKHKRDPGSESDKYADEIKAWGEQAWKTWKREAVEVHRKAHSGSHLVSYWKEAFKTALSSSAMKPFVKEHGSERTKWQDVEESARRLVAALLEADDEAEKCGPLPDVSDDPNRYPWPVPVPRRVGGFRYELGRLVHPKDEVIQPKAGSPEKPTAAEQVKLKLETEEDEEVQRYLQLVKAQPHLKRYSREQLRQYLANRPPAEPEPLSEPHRIVQDALDMDEPNLDQWSERLSMEDQLSDLFGGPGHPYFTDDPESAWRWDKLFTFGGGFSVFVGFTLFYKVKDAPSAVVHYEFERPGFAHRDSETVHGQYHIVKLAELLKDTMKTLKDAPSSLSPSAIIRAFSVPFRYAYTTERGLAED